MTRSDGAITASWPAVTGADGYTVEYSAVGNGKWITAASNHAGTGITIAGVNNGHTYLVGVSAEKRPDKGPPQVSPPAGPYSKQKPDAPPSVTVLRADGKLTAFWNSGWGAESYRVMYTSDGGENWTLAAASHPVGTEPPASTSALTTPRRTPWASAPTTGTGTAPGATPPPAGRMFR